jgi:hypothetical protein
MRRRYVVERTDATGHWLIFGVTTIKRLALREARDLAQHPPSGRRRVTVRVRISPRPSGNYRWSPWEIAGWINGGSAWGEAFR